MKKMYFKYGSGKTTDLCQTAYKYAQQGKKVIIMNADGNKTIKTKLVKKNGEPLLTLEPNFAVTNNIFAEGFTYQDKDIAAILVDNAHLLSANQVEQLFYLCKVFDITVITYGERLLEGNPTKGSIRLLELANNLEPVNTVSQNEDNLIFHYGVMDSGKTSQLLCTASDLEYNGQKIVVVKPFVDRSVELVESRNGLSRKADIILSTDDSMKDMGYELAKNHVSHILVDEAQFLTEKQIGELEDISKCFRIPVDCYGLRTDFQTHSFTGSKRLLEIANLQKMRAICACKDNAGADYNARKIDGEYVSVGDQVAVDNGKTISYDSLCDRCYLEKVQDLPLEEPVKVLKILYKKNII